MISETIEESDYPEEDIEDDESGDGDDHASLALNTPEPARAAMAGKAPKEDGQAARKRGSKYAKAKIGSKSALGEHFVRTAYEGLGDNTKSTAIQITLTATAYGLKESSGETAESEDEPEELSAFDRDEITDREMSGDEVELLAMLAGLHEKPWENEKLSMVERMMLKQG